MAERNPNFWYSSRGVDYYYDNNGPKGRTTGGTLATPPQNYQVQNAGAGGGVDLSKNKWVDKTTPTFGAPSAGSFGSGTILGNPSLGTSKNPNELTLTDLSAISKGLPQTTGNMTKITGQVSSPYGNSQMPNSSWEETGANPGFSSYGENVQGGGVRGGAINVTPQPGGAPSPAGVGNPLGAVSVTPSGTSTVAASSLDPTLKAYLDEKMQRERESYNSLKDLAASVRGRQDPFGTDTESFRSRLASRQDNLTRAFNGAERAYMSKVARGGTMGGYNAAGVGNIISGRARGFEDVTNQTYGEAADKSYAFQQAKDGTLASLAAAMGGDASGLASSLAKLDAAERRYATDRQDGQNALDQQTLAAVLSAAPSIAKLLLGGI